MDLLFHLRIVKQKFSSLLYKKQSETVFNIRHYQQNKVIINK